MSFKKCTAYFIRLIGCLAVLSIISGVCIGIRSAIVDYEPIVVELHGTFSQEQKIKVFYARNITDEFDNSHMQEFHVNAGESDVKFEIQKLDKMKKVKFEFERNVGQTTISDIKISCLDQIQKLDNLNNFKPSNMTEFMIDGSKMMFTSTQVNPSVVYSDTFNIRSSGHVWFFPLNKYTLSFLAIVVFSGFWWLLSVISKINSDIEEAFKR